MPMNTGTAVRELKIGPYAGGINRYSDQSAIADDELVDCINFDIDLDGSLKSRPPWKVLFGESISGAVGVNQNYGLILLTGTYESIRFIIFKSTDAGDPVEIPGVYIYYLDGPNAGLRIQLPGVTDSEVAVRYNNSVYLVPMADPVDVLDTGWEYDLDTGIVTTIPNMPRGYSAAVYKDRLWVCGRKNVGTNSRLYFSELADFNTWPGVNFFDVNPGDGDTLHDLTVYQDNLMLFKDSATYVLSYDSGPAQAVLQTVNTDVGVTGPHSVVPYENSIFVLKYNEVYEMVNYDYTRVSVKIPFEYDPTFPGDTGSFALQAWQYPRWMRACGDRLVVRFWNRLYVYHLRLRAWTRWESEDSNIAALGPIMRLDNTNANSNDKEGHEAYVAMSSLLISPDVRGDNEPGNRYYTIKIYQFDDWYDSDSVENGNVLPPPIGVAESVDIKCKLLTKTYDIGVSHRFKRLMHWGVDTITARTITGTVFPFSLAYKPTWGQLHIYHWHDLNTWGYPLFSVPSTEQTQPVGAGIARRYIRFPKSLRFRLVQFQVDMLTVGNLSDGPARLYSVTAFIGGKQLVPAAVN